MMMTIIIMQLLRVSTNTFENAKIASDVNLMKSPNDHLHQMHSCAMRFLSLKQFDNGKKKSNILMTIEK